MSDTASAEAHGHTHADVSGGWLRAAVFGAMDGLVTNTALVAGVGGAGAPARTVVGTPAARSRATNSRCAGSGLASHWLPGVGLSGIRFTWASRFASSLPSRSARNGWSLTSRISAYSME